MNLILEHQLKQLFPNASQSVINANRTKTSRKAPVLEHTAKHDALAAPQVQKAASKRVLVCVESRRHRLLDEDNLAEKYVVDLCRYSGMLRSDCPGETQIKVSQVKIPREEQEEIIITITP